MDDQHITHEIGIYSITAMHAALRNKNRDWLALNQDNESEWSDMSMTVVSASTMNIPLSRYLVQSGHRHPLIV